MIRTVLARTFYDPAPQNPWITIFDLQGKLKWPTDAYRLSMAIHGYPTLHFLESLADNPTSVKRQALAYLNLCCTAQESDKCAAKVK